MSPPGAERTGPRRRRAADDKHLRRDMGIVGMLFASVGSIIGSGWLFGALIAAEKAGPAAIIAWVMGGIMVLFIALCYAELGTMFPVSGGVARFPQYSFGSFASYTLGWLTWIAVVSTTAIEVLAALQYGANYVPWLQTLSDGQPVLTGPGFAVAIGFLALFSVVNVLGIRWFARLNNALVWWKLGIIALVIVVLLASVFHGGHFADKTAGGFMPFGMTGVFSSVATAGIVFSFLGFRQAIEFAGESRNPHRAVPIAVIGSILITIVLYVALQIAFIGALPGRALVEGWAHIGTHFMSDITDVSAAFGPLAALATVLGITWLAILLYIDAFVSPMDTGLIYASTSARVSYAMGRNRNAPLILALVSKRGVPWVSIILTFVIGSLCLLPFPSWQKLVGFNTSATVLSFGAGPVVLLALRRQLPREERPFRLPVSYLLSYLGFLSASLIVYWSGWDVVWKLMIATLIGYVVFTIHEARYHERTPTLHFRSGAWVLVWLAGLTLISWTGDFPSARQHAGNLHLLNLGWSMLVVAVFAALVMWMAVALRLPRKDVEQSVFHPGHDDDDEALAISPGA